MALIPPCKIGTKFASINNKLIAPEFHIPGDWFLRVSWMNMLHGMSGIGGLPMGVPTADTNSSNYSVQIFWDNDRLEWTNRYSGFYTGISAAASDPNAYYNLYDFGYYHDWPVSFELEYYATDSAGNPHPLPESLDFHWSGAPGYFYIDLCDSNRPDAYTICQPSAFPTGTVATNVHQLHYDLVYPTGW